MLDFSRVQNYYIACGYTDMRKQIDGLAALVQTQFGQEMDETSLYLFCGRRADRIRRHNRTVAFAATKQKLEQQMGLIFDVLVKHVEYGKSEEASETGHSKMKP